MHAASLLFSAVVLAVSLVAAAELKIEIIKAVECERKTKSGDEISVEYTGTFTNGTVFDTSMTRISR
jgi:FK506-binding protein 2